MTFHFAKRVGSHGELPSTLSSLQPLLGSAGSEHIPSSPAVAIWDRDGRLACFGLYSECCQHLQHQFHRAHSRGSDSGSQSERGQQYGSRLFLQQAYPASSPRRIVPSILIVATAAHAS
ncbi:DUF6436 domain-containing protein [Pseudomonas chaetocerotis]